MCCENTVIHVCFQYTIFLKRRTIEEYYAGLKRNEMWLEDSARDEGVHRPFFFLLSDDDDYIAAIVLLPPPKL